MFYFFVGRFDGSFFSVTFGERFKLIFLAGDVSSTTSTGSVARLLALSVRDDIVDDTVELFSSDLGVVVGTVFVDLGELSFLIVIGDAALV